MLTNDTEYALELIAIERQEQIAKHGFTNEHALANPQYYASGEQLQAALFSLASGEVDWPSNWNTEFREKILRKPRMQQLVVAGALIAAEIERLYSIRHLTIVDVVPMTLIGKSPVVDNWDAWKGAFILAQIADGDKREIVEQYTDWSIAREEFDNGISAIEAYKRMNYEDYA